MRLDSGCFRFAGTFAHRRWLRPLTAFAAIVLLLAVPSGARAQGPSTSKSTAHVYLLRGVLNVFSMGMDQIAYKLEQRGIATTVTNYLLWSSVADDAAAAYKSGKVRTIILVGHSSGATALPDMVDRLTRLGAPVKLAIGSGFRVSDDADGQGWPLYQLLYRQWRGHTRCAGQKLAGRAVECRRREYTWRRRSRNDRQERNHTAESHKRDPLLALDCRPDAETAATGEGGRV